ncbi:hypothetical protein CHS0354_042659 [Potamilus streckersoni]|uniref:C2H2-type domain-containing protein n=1 Tax=Potamilus streckersoni TaxID=2493646 RepID=A0AAE0TEA3_9BIVA|nr:hypothetical protein CHS0354_042659 [Potamilus streckersoni]
MPRGFLVKRTKHITAYSYRVRHLSDDDRSESGSDQEYPTCFGSPDSGYSASPIPRYLREKYISSFHKDNTSTKSPILSPISVSTGTYPSPLYYSAFDRLSVSSSSPLPQNLTVTDSATFSPCSPSKKRGSTDTGQNEDSKPKTPKKPKAARKINFDEDTSSPVSGTIIRALSDMYEEEGKVVCGDIDSRFNYVEVTPEAKAELEKIENKIGDYICQLCKEHYDDAFQLAQHRCSRIVHIEYRCPECDKVFNCPANLASHRRWHKPRPNSLVKASSPANILPATVNPDQTNGNPSSLVDQSETVLPSEDGQYSCVKCGKKFKRRAYLRKHMASHDTEPSFPCQYCGKQFVNENLRAKHEFLHTSGNKELTCTICNQDFSDKYTLEKHVGNHANDIYSCKYCDSTFCTSPGLTRHINKCHPTENRQVILLQLPINRPC